MPFARTRRGRARSVGRLRRSKMPSNFNASETFPRTRSRPLENESSPLRFPRTTPARVRGSPEMVVSARRSRPSRRRSCPFWIRRVQNSPVPSSSTTEASTLRTASEMRCGRAAKASRRATPRAGSSKPARSGRIQRGIQVIGASLPGRFASGKVCCGTNSDSSACLGSEIERRRVATCSTRSYDRRPRRLKVFRGSACAKWRVEWSRTVEFTTSGMASAQLGWKLPVALRV